jgi:hypothetical protein
MKGASRQYMLWFLSLISDLPDHTFTPLKHIYDGALQTAYFRIGGLWAME